MKITWRNVFICMNLHTSSFNMSQPALFRLFVIQVPSPGIFWRGFRFAVFYWLDFMKFWYELHHLTSVQNLMFDKEYVCSCKVLHRHGWYANVCVCVCVCVCDFGVREERERVHSIGCLLFVQEYVSMSLLTLFTETLKYLLRKWIIVFPL